MLFARYNCFATGCIKRIKSSESVLYLSFDDGPNPEITPKVLELLKRYNAKATFFCIGKNAEQYPEILNLIKQNGHTIGNHSYSHLNAFKTSKTEWLNDVFKQSPISNSKFFRPPYGKINPFTLRQLKLKYKIILWDVLSYDYNPNISLLRIKKLITKTVRNGSIIVFHDTEKAQKNMLPSLAFTLEYFSKKQYKFERITNPQ